MQAAGEEWDEVDSVFLDFLEAVSRAKNESEIALVSKIHKAGEDQQVIDRILADGTKIYKTVKGDWRAFAFLLERRFAARWGSKHQVDINVVELSMRLAIKAGVSMSDVQAFMKGSNGEQKAISEATPGKIIDVESVNGRDGRSS